MEPERPRRRRSAWWLRELPRETLHRIGGRLYNEAQLHDLSKGQEALWAMVVSELEYRNRRITPADRCTCLLCFEPYLHVEEAELPDTGVGPFDEL